MIGRFAPSVSEESTQLKGFDDFDLRLGDIMRGERATLGKSLLDVQRELKIKASYIAAIENSDPSAFETPGFIAGYVRSYARYLGMDPDQAFAEFCQESGFQTSDGMSAGAKSANKPAQPHRPRRTPGVHPLADPNATFVPRGAALANRIEPGAIGSVMVLAALIGVIGFGGWTVLREIQQVDFSPTDDVIVTAGAAVDPLAETRTLLDGVEAADGSIGEIDPEQERRSAALDRLYSPDPLEVPVLEPRDGPIAAVDPRSFGVLAPAVSELADPADIATISPDTASPFDSAATERRIQVSESLAPELVLVAVRPAWVRVRGATGTILFEKVLDAGEEYVLPQTEEPPILRVGESGAVYFAVNGQHFGPAGPDGVVTKDIILSAEALSTAYLLADPTLDQDLARMVAEAHDAEVETPAE